MVRLKGWSWGLIAGLGVAGVLTVALSEGLRDWLSLPLSGADEHRIASWASWHGRLMVLSWSLMLPLGALIARFFKVTPGQDWPGVLDNKTWWRAHLWLQGGGCLIAVLGLLLVLGRVDLATDLAHWHHLGGWLLMIFAGLQVLGGLLRGSKGGPTAPELRGDHYDMTPHRVLFERLHKSIGWLAMLVALATTLAGLAVADSPRWMFLLIGSWWLSLIGAAVFLQRAGRCIDTYQAIWGPDPAHPGNHLRPIGWGIARFPFGKKNISQEEKVSRKKNLCQEEKRLALERG